MPSLLLPSCYPKDLFLHYIFCLFNSFIYALGSSLVSCPVFLTTCSVVIRCLLCRVRFLKIWAFLFQTWHTKSWNKSPCPTWEAAGSPVCVGHIFYYQVVQNTCSHLQKEGEQKKKFFTTLLHPGRTSVQILCLYFSSWQNNFPCWHHSNKYHRIKQLSSVMNWHFSLTFSN